MVERDSPLGPLRRPGRHGHSRGAPGVRLAEVTPAAICEAAAWPGAEAALAEAIAATTGLGLDATPGAGARSAEAAAFGIGPGRFLVTGRHAGLVAALAAAVSADTGTVTDLSHGRTVMRIAGPRAEWVLGKLFAIDFAADAFAVGAGRATAHHDIAAQIQRSADDAFDICVFRSFARAFWAGLCTAAEEVGYEVL